MTRRLLTLALATFGLLAACGDDLPPPLVEDTQATPDTEQGDVSGGDEVSFTDAEPGPAEDAEGEQGAQDAEDGVEDEVMTEDVDASEEVLEPADTDDDIEISIAPFVCTDDASCQGRVEVQLCERATCIAGHCAALPDLELEGQECDDGNVCSTGNICSNGLCTAGVPVDCSALSNPPCTLGVCDIGQGGCVAVLSEEGLPCDDADPCTESDLCVGGVCEGTSLCDDGDVCNGYEGCEPETGACLPGVPLTCDGTDPCLGTSFCDSVFGCVVGAPPDCGEFVCGDGGCPSSCVEHAQCVPGTYCDDGGCSPTLEDGSGCGDDGMCTSGYCDGALCCSGGQCCTADAQCPLTEVGVLVSQESYDPESGFARVVVTEATGGLQTLVSLSSGVLERIDFMLQTNPDEGYLVQVNIWSGVPPGAGVLGTTTLLVLAATNEPTVWTATLTEPISVEAGQTISVGLSWLNGDADCQIGCGVIWMGSEGDPYPEGTIHRTFDSGASWHATDFNDDLFVRLWAGQHSCENFSCVGAP